MSLSSPSLYRPHFGASPESQISHAVAHRPAPRQRENSSSSGGTAVVALAAGLGGGYLTRFFPNALQPVAKTSKALWAGAISGPLLGAGSLGWKGYDHFYPKNAPKVDLSGIQGQIDGLLKDVSGLSKNAAPDLSGLTSKVDALEKTVGAGGTNFDLTRFANIEAKLGDINDIKKKFDVIEALYKKFHPNA